MDGIVLPHFQLSGSQSILFRCAISLLQMRNQFSSDFHFRIFEIFVLTHDLPAGFIIVHSEKKVAQNEIA